MALKYYADMKYAPLSDLLSQSRIKTENKFMTYSDSSSQYYPDTGRSTGSYNIFTKVVQLIMAHMFQENLLNQVQKVCKIQHELQEWI